MRLERIASGASIVLDEPGGTISGRNTVFYDFPATGVGRNHVSACSLLVTMADVRAIMDALARDGCAEAQGMRADLALAASVRALVAKGDSEPGGEHDGAAV